MRPTSAATVVTAGPWLQTNADAAMSRNNPAETTLTPSNVKNATYLRSVTARPQTGPYDCAAQNITAPVFSGGYVYAAVAGYLTKTSASTGALVWRSKIYDTPTNIAYNISIGTGTGLDLVSIDDCTSVSSPFGWVEAFNDSTGAKAWLSSNYSDPVDEMML